MWDCGLHQFDVDHNQKNIISHKTTILLLLPYHIYIAYIYAAGADAAVMNLPSYILSFIFSNMQYFGN
jgi:hypothetical protein